MSTRLLNIVTWPRVEWRVSCEAACFRKVAICAPYAGIEATTAFGKTGCKLAKLNWVAGRQGHKSAFQGKRLPAALT